MTILRATLGWAIPAAAAGGAIAAAAVSPLLAWRDPVYILAGFAGVAALALMLFQPLLAGGYLPGLPQGRGRRLHRLTGAALVLGVAIHVAGLWITSPPDVVDALLFASPTPFSAWGVIAMWSVLATAVLAVFRKRFHRRLRAWRRGHTGFAAVAIAGSVVHALLIEGTMETQTKAVLCALAILATARAIHDLGSWKAGPGRDG